MPRNTIQPARARYIPEIEINAFLRALGTNDAVCDAAAAATNSRFLRHGSLYQASEGGRKEAELTGGICDERGGDTGSGSDFCATSYDHGSSTAVLVPYRPGKDPASD
ncbi:hypothetical protein Bbelb_168940 [Branchiostoma belcheri]|nr:hypothetical protein Bbelb_168940 [Branchiostoma belcheri]